MIDSLQHMQCYQCMRLGSASSYSIVYHGYVCVFKSVPCQAERVLSGTHAAFRAFPSRATT